MPLSARILGGGGNACLHGQVHPDCFYFGSPHLGRVADVVEVDVAFDPVGIGFFPSADSSRLRSGQAGQAARME